MAMNQNDSSEILSEPLNKYCGFYFHGGTLLEKGETEFQTYEVWDTPHFGRLFRLDGFFMTSERDEFFYHENMIHPAAVTHPNPEKILIIGGGDGGCAEEIFKHPSVQQVVMVELDGGVVDIARKYFSSIHQGSLDDTRLVLRIEDGLVYVREKAPAAGEKFDLIILDLTDPIGPAAELYSLPFIRECKELLNPDGVFILHTGPPVFDPNRVSGQVKILTDAFSIVAPYFVYIPLYGTLWGMATCSDTIDPRQMSKEDVNLVIQRRGLSELQYYNGGTHEAVFVLPEYIKRLLES